MFWPFMFVISSITDVSRLILIHFVFALFEEKKEVEEQTDMQAEPV